MSDPLVTAANRTKGAGNEASAAAIVLGVILAIVLLSVLIVFLRTKAQVKQCELYQSTVLYCGVFFRAMLFCSSVRRKHVLHIL